MSEPVCFEFGVCQKCGGELSGVWRGVRRVCECKSERKELFRRFFIPLDPIDQFSIESHCRHLASGSHH